ncbi:MAG: TrbC/VirB2 family protein [Alphaproteobacteria bacterium]|jgi:type IV secretory pathway VirB2 component (pilin)|nr:TrbC/VirB2 family protein [Alphaproteobacteria bacterium]
MNVSVTRQAFFAFAAVLVMLGFLADPALAQSGNVSGAGSNLLNTLQTAITGNLGLFIGLAIVVLGLWTWIIRQETGAGITMIIGGVVITLAPGLFNGVRTFMGEAISGFGGNVNTVQRNF